MPSSMRRRLSGWAVWAGIAGAIAAVNWIYFVTQGELIPVKPIRNLQAIGVPGVMAFLMCLAPIAVTGPAALALGIFAHKHHADDRPGLGLALVVFANVIGGLGTLAGACWIVCMAEAVHRMGRL